jgi:hypothetical protein
MSVLSTLALLVTTAAVKLKANREAEDPARAIAELEAQRDELRRERDDWRARAEAWRERALERIEVRPPQAAGPDFRPPQLAQAQLAQWQQAQGLAMAQYAQQQAQQYQQNLGMQQQNYLNQGLLGAQALQMPAEWCNCVPARHDMFLSGNGA